eukprot:599075-Pyramimonas_sp.AAC.1
MASQRCHPPCAQARRRRQSPLGPSGDRAARCRRRTGSVSSPRRVRAPPTWRHRAAPHSACSSQ